MTQHRSKMQLNRANLAPFAHELDRRGQKCAEDCPACHWVREQLARELVKSLDLKPDYSDCELFQRGLEATGLIPA
jgi:hypothetical protein